MLDTADRINSFSLVSYVPGALGEFLTGLRRELVSDCIARAHVTVLPPRPLAHETKEAEEFLLERIGDYPPFFVEMPTLRIFGQTYVIYAEVGTGSSQLMNMHEDLNTGPLAFAEPYEYHPHVTLAQGIAPEDVGRTYELALERWNESVPGNGFPVETLTFVQNTLQNRWVDLTEFELGRPVAVQS
jgi:2'-5' RNA ligase